MSIIKAFRAVRPAENLASTVASVPYDVVNVEEARGLAQGNPDSFLHVTRAEIDLPAGTDVYSSQVYDLARKNLADLEARGVLIGEEADSLYVYRLTMNGKSQTSVVATCSIDEYDRDLIKKHEKTRPDKENDRTNHMVTTRAQTGLIFLCYRGTDAINTIVETVTSSGPLYNFTAPDGIRHEVWRVAETPALTAAFGDVPFLYVADGHHRAASASRARKTLREQNDGAPGEYDYVIAALFPTEQLQILAYNRVVRDLGTLTYEAFLDRLKQDFVVTQNVSPTPAERGTFCMYLGGKWFGLKPRFEKSDGVIESLDVSVLENHVLHPILGIGDVRTDKRIDFVGGMRGTGELEKLVDSGSWKVAFSMFPTSMDDLLNVADVGEIMPPKSTWFEPKLRDGLLVHKI